MVHEPGKVDVSRVSGISYQVVLGGEAKKYQLSVCFPTIEEAIDFMNGINHLTIRELNRIEYDGAMIARKVRVDIGYG